MDFCDSPLPLDQPCDLKILELNFSQLTGILSEHVLQCLFFRGKHVGR